MGSLVDAAVVGVGGTVPRAVGAASMMGAARVVAGAAAVMLKVVGASGTAPTTAGVATVAAEGADAAATVEGCGCCCCCCEPGTDGRRAPKLVATALMAEREEASACCSTSSLVSGTVAIACAVLAAAGTAAAACVAAEEVATAGRRAGSAAVIELTAEAARGPVMAGAADAATQKRTASKPPRDGMAVRSRVVWCTVTTSVQSSKTPGFG